MNDTLEIEKLEERIRRLTQFLKEETNNINYGIIWDERADTIHQLHILVTE